MAKAQGGLGGRKRYKTKTGGVVRKDSASVSLPVVGIGASAGGLEALSAFLRALPPRTGLAIVVIQHLSPEHESALTQLLSKATTMPVTEVSDGMVLESNHVYVIPPNKSMTIRGGALRLAPRERTSLPHRPIDEFYTALARERRSAAIGVILSGSGSDGTLGMKAIKSEGGITFAQDPKTAAWPDMPANAISAGAVDFVPPPAGIAVELGRIGRHPYLHEQSEVPGGDGLEGIHGLLVSVTGVDFRFYKEPMVGRRIARRMAVHRMGSLGEYARFLKDHPAEVTALAEDIFIHVTSFFRDPECFQALRKQVLPKLHLERRDDPVRIWVPGCSTGEEVYSLAILLLEWLGENAHGTKIQLFGTDISEQAVARARAGIYTEAAMRGISRARLKRFFVRVEQGFQVNKDARGLCVFARHDLANDPPFSKLDLISCRNVLIYAKPVLQDRILKAFQYALKRGGFLFLGKAEAISTHADVFTAVDRNHKIFTCRPSPNAAPPFDWQVQAQRPHGVAAATMALPAAPADFRKEAEQLLLRLYAPPALVVDGDLRILHYQGDISAYLTLSTGPPTVHLLKMLRPELIVGVRRAVSKARKEGTIIATEPIQFEQGSVRLEVSPLKNRDPRKWDFVIVFKVIQPSQAPRRKTGSRSDQELKATREYLRSVIAEHETDQEYMKAAHQEALSSGEELQSANEELETAKEELQSSNEELQTLNEELRQRNLDLGAPTRDLNNVLVGVDLPLVVLDGSHCIRRFTPTAGKLLKLIETDIGRPFSDIAPALEVPDWETLFAEVTRQGLPIEREVRDRNGHWYSLRIRSFRSSDNKVDGMIVMLLDTDMIQRELAESRDYARMLLESAEQAIIAADTRGRIVLINSATERMFGYSRPELLGNSVELLLPGGISSAPGRKIRLPSPGGTNRPSGHGQKQEGRHKNGTRFPLEISASIIEQAGVRLTVAFVKDITEPLRLEGLEKTYREEIRALAAQLITVQEEERRRVSRELHDSLCQQLASLAFDVENLADALPGPASTRSRLRALRARTVKISAEARHIAYELHPSVLDDLGLGVSLKALCEEFSKAQKIRVTFTADELPDRIPEEVASGLYRIAQESLQNVAKHAKAIHLSVSLTARKHDLALTIEDDGVGFAPQAAKGRGLGLVSIRERARIMGGTLSIDSKRGKGTRISVRVPTV